MIGLSILLFWLPVAGPLIAGIVGGRKAGSIGGAIIAAILPAIIAAGLLLGAGTLFALPLIGAVAGLAVFVVIVAEGVPLIIGAIIGAALD